jgi:serine/threonine-protein kinase RsbW
VIEQEAVLDAARSVWRTWSTDPAMLAELRTAVRTWLAPLGFSDETAEDIVLAVNEAASNCIDHAYPTGHIDNAVKLNLWISDLTAHLEIVDHGRWRPARAGVSDRGFGIPIMRRLIDNVFIHHGPTGTAVLLRHPLPTTAR